MVSVQYHAAAPSVSHSCTFGTKQLHRFGTASSIHTYYQLPLTPLTITLTNLNL